MTATILLTVAMALMSAEAAAQSTEDKKGPGGLVPLNPPPIPVDPTPKLVKIAGPPPSRAGDSADAGALRGAQALAMKEGEARVRLAEGERTVRPGDTIGVDVVKSINPGQVVLVRGRTATDPEGSATVVVKFDEQGRSQVRVYYLKDPAPVVAPGVK